MTGFLEGQLALVTGASRGIGAATAEALAREGAHVVITARTAQGLEEVEERVHAAGGSATIAPLDLTDGDSIARLAAAIGGRWEALDLLVLNAATLGSLGPVPAIDGKEFNKVLTLNLIAQQALIAAFDPLLRKSRQGRVIAMTSSVAARPRAFWGAYAATKAAGQNLIQCWADEIESTNIRVAVLDPGRMQTRLRAQAYPGEDPSVLPHPSEIAPLMVDLCRPDREPPKGIVSFREWKDGPPVSALV